MRAATTSSSATRVADRGELGSRRAISPTCWPDFLTATCLPRTSTETVPESRNSRWLSPPPSAKMTSPSCHDSILHTSPSAAANSACPPTTGWVCSASTKKRRLRSPMNLCSIVCDALAENQVVEITVLGPPWQTVLAPGQTRCDHGVGELAAPTAAVATHRTTPSRRSGHSDWMMPSRIASMTASRRLAAPSLRRKFSTWFRAVYQLIPSSSATYLVSQPNAT